jgi:hypothetical protein
MTSRRRTPNSRHAGPKFSFLWLDRLSLYSANRCSGASAAHCGAAQRDALFALGLRDHLVGDAIAVGPRGRRVDREVAGGAPMRCVTSPRTAAAKPSSCTLRQHGGPRLGSELDPLLERELDPHLVESVAHDHRDAAEVGLEVALEGEQRGGV